MNKFVWNLRVAKVLPFPHPDPIENEIRQASHGCNLQENCIYLRFCFRNAWALLFGRALLSAGTTICHDSDVPDLQREKIVSTPSLLLCLLADPTGRQGGRQTFVETNMFGRGASGLLTKVIQ